MAYPGYKNNFRSQGVNPGYPAFNGTLAYNDRSSAYTPDQHFGDARGDILIDAETTYANTANNGNNVYMGTRAFRYCLFDANSATPAEGDILIFNDNTATIVTANQASISGNRNRPAGAVLGNNTGGPANITVVNTNNTALTNNLWLQIRGYHPNLNFTGTATVTIGDIAILSGTDKVLTNIAAGTAPTYTPVAVILSNITANYAAGYLRVPE